MWSILVITCIIFQTAVAIFLLNGLRGGTGIDKHLKVLLVILLFHLSTKFLLLAVLKDQFLYAQIPTGFSLAYGPLLLVITRSLLGRPMRPRTVLYQFLPFLLLSLMYVSLVVGGAIGSVSKPVVSAYAAWYQWLLLPSIYGYPLYVKWMLRKKDSAESRLIRQMANVFLFGISAGLIQVTLRFTIPSLYGFDLRLIPYCCFSAIPIIILRYRLRKSDEKRMEEIPGAAVAAIAREADKVIVPASMDHPDPADKRYEKSGIDGAKLDEYEVALAGFMQKSRIYLDADLSLEGLATRMKMPKHHLTQLLNERVMKNFYTFINEYRIGEAVVRIKERPKDVNILSLAFDCGFNSRSSFNNYFKKITGNTPSAYRKQQLEEKVRAGATRLIPGTSPSIS